MNKIYLLLFFSLSYGLSLAQTVLSNGGNEYSSSDAKMSFTIGETLIGDFTKSNESLTQGFHSNPIFVVSDIKNITQELTIEIFPNPTSSVLNVHCPNLKNDEQLNLKIVSSNSQLVKNLLLDEAINMLDLMELSKGDYFVQIYKYSELIYTSKLIKNE